MTEEEKKVKKLEYQREWRRNHIEKMREAHRNDYKKHKEDRIKWQHQYYKNNKNKRSEYEGEK